MTARRGPSHPRPFPAAAFRAAGPAFAAPFAPAFAAGFASTDFAAPAFVAAVRDGFAAFAGEGFVSERASFPASRSFVGAARRLEL